MAFTSRIPAASTYAKLMRAGSYRTELILTSTPRLSDLTSLTGLHKPIVGR